MAMKLDFILNEPLESSNLNPPERSNCINANQKNFRYRDYGTWIVDMTTTEGHNAGRTDLTELAADISYVVDLLVWVPRKNPARMIQYSLELKGCTQAHDKNAISVISAEALGKDNKSWVEVDRNGRVIRQWLEAGEVVLEAEKDTTAGSITYGKWVAKVLTFREYTDSNHGKVSEITDVTDVTED